MKSAKQRLRLLYATALVISDASMTVWAVFAAYWLRRLVPFPEPSQGIAPFFDYAPLIVLQMACVVSVFAFADLYRIVRGASRVDEFYTIVAAYTVSTLLSVAFFYLVFKNTALDMDYPRAMVAYAWALGIVFVTLSRLLQGYVRGRLLAQGIGKDRVLIVGTGAVGQMILQKILGNPTLGYQVVGFVSANGPETAVLGTPVLGSASNLALIIEEYAVEEVIIALPDASHREILLLIAECERGAVTIRVFPDVFQIIASQVSIGDLGGLPLLTVRDVALRGWRQGAKRLMDVVGALVGLVFLSPLMILMAVIIKIESPGPVFYAQERMGLDARPFWCLKFRSMRQDAERSGPGWTTASDPRRTRIGSLLRRLNLDELPQFINVLLGEMSLVGPRPERPVYVDQFRRSIPRYMDRHREKAGLTGWAQVNGLRGDTSIIERTKYDLWYIENWSLLLDVKILIRTLLSFFRSPNAY